MNRRWSLIVLLSAAVASVLAFQVRRSPQPPAPPESLAGYLPAGALLCLEAQNFGGLLDEWSRSGTKARWLASDNYAVFANSNLYKKLGDLYGEYGAVAGVAPDLPGLRSMAGRESALGLYQVREGEFVFITKLPAAAAARSVLGRKQSTFAARESAGLPFSVKLGERTVALAIVKGYFLVSTREDLMAQALALVAGQGSASVKAESWYQRATAAAAKVGELRLTLDLPRVTADAGFRTYWLPQNRTELATFQAAVADVFRSPGTIREERVLVKEEDVPAQNGVAVGELAQFVPGSCGICRLDGAPAVPFVLASISEKLLDPQPGAQVQPEVEPAAEGPDFESSIEIAPPPRGRLGPDLHALEALLRANPPTAMLTAQNHVLAPDRVLVKMPATIALSAARDWNAEAVRQAFTSATGIGWRPASRGNGWWQEEGFGRRLLAVQGRVLMLSNDEAELVAVATSKAADASAAQSTRWARVAVARELPLYAGFTKALEPPAQEPPLFSANLLSLVRATGTLQSITVNTQEHARQRQETVTYSWK